MSMFRCQPSFIFLQHTNAMIGDRNPLFVWHAAELTVTMVAIGIPVCRPLWKTWVHRLLPDRTTTDQQGSSGFSQSKQLYTIGGSPMPLVNGVDSKGSKGHRSQPSNSKFAAKKELDTVELSPLRDIEEAEPPRRKVGRASWSSWSRRS